MKVFITGGTGLIGQRLVAALVKRGDDVTVLSRRPQSQSVVTLDRLHTVQGDPTEAGAWLEHLQKADAVVHLAGENVSGKRWNARVKEAIRESRVKSTALLAGHLAQAPRTATGAAKVFVSGSAVGYYGANTGDVKLTESSPAGSDFLAQVAVAWEAAAELARQAGVRVVHPRTGIVLDPAGGALPKLALPFQVFVGGPVGNGKQYMNWIHHEDMTGLLLHALDTPSLNGPMNAVAPGAVPNREFSRVLARVLGRWSWLPVPVFALRVLLGEMTEVLAGGTNATPNVAQASGYTFKFPTLEPALRQIYKKPAE
jgi:hypothetical protein